MPPVDGYSGGQVQALRGLIETAAGKAAAALSQMTAHEVIVSVPEVWKAKAGEVAQERGRAQGPACCVEMSLVGEPGGLALLTFDRGGAFNLAGLLTGEAAPADGILSEMALSALSEVGNVVISGVANALGQALRSPSFTSVPKVSEGELSALLDAAVEAADERADGEILVVETRFAVASSPEISARLWVLPRVKALGGFLAKLAASQPAGAACAESV
jgi:chemotaxis protein CheC